MMSRTLFIYFLFSGVIFLAYFEQTFAIKCYKCQVTPNYRMDKNLSTMLCSKFDGSNDYVVDCPYSTMCLKNIYKLKLQNRQTIETVTRGCANQKYTDQVFKQGTWRREHKVEEPYEEGCKDFEENTLSASRTTNCHCRGNLCNSASKESSGYHTDAMAVIFVFNAMKYLRSGTAH